MRVILLTILLSCGYIMSSFAQYVVPWRDITPVSATNSAPPAVSDKSGYTLISDILGRWRIHKMDSLLLTDSLDASSALGQQTKIRLLSNNTPVDSIYITSNQPDFIDSLYIRDDSLCLAIELFNNGSYTSTDRCIALDELGGVSFDSIVYDADVDTLCFYMPGDTLCTYFPIDVTPGDQVFYDFGTSDTPVPSDDSVETTNVKYVLFNGLDGGLPTKIEMLKEGILQFDKSGLLETNIYLFKIKPLQSGVGVNDFGITAATHSNAVGSVMNDTYQFGINPGGLQSGSALYWAFEGHYKPNANAYNELHLVYRDSTGNFHRVETYFLNKGDYSANSAGTYLKQWDLRKPDPSSSEGHFFRIYSENDNATGMRILGAGGSIGGSQDGVEHYVNILDNNYQINPYGDMPSNATMYGNFDISQFQKLVATESYGGSSSAIWGWSSGFGAFEKVSLDTTINISSNILSVDTFLIGTHHYIDSAIGAAPGGSDADIFKVGTTDPPDDITDEGWRTGGLAIGLNDPDTELHVYGPSADIDNVDESVGRLILEGDATNALHLGNSVTFPYGSWIQSGGGSNPGTLYPLLLNPLGGNTGIGNQDPQQTLHVTGTARITGSSGAAVTIAGRDGDGDINAITPGEGLELIDNILHLTGGGSDSIYTTDTTVCFILMGDTTCVLLDSSYITDSTYCYIFAGDTTCVEFGTQGGTIYTTDGSFTDNRTATVLANKYFRIVRNDPLGTSEIFKVEPSGNTNSVILGLNSAAVNKPMMTMRNIAGAGNVYMKFENIASHYSLGIDKSTGLFNISEGASIHDGTAHYMSFSNAGDSIIFKRDVQFDDGILDKDGDYGTSGYVLSTTGTEVNWIPASSGAAISSLTDGVSTNTIDSDDYLQEWQWNTLAGGTGLKLSSTSTAAASNTQKLFEASLSGANANTGQSTYGGYFSNTHTGTGSTNYGIYANATNGDIFSYGIYGSAVAASVNDIAMGVRGSVSGSSGQNNAGVYGNSTQATYGYGVRGVASGAGSVAVIGENTSVTGLAVAGEQTNTSASTSLPVIALRSTESSVTDAPAPGFGGSLLFSSSLRLFTPTILTGRIDCTWTDTTYAARDSKMAFSISQSGSEAIALTLDADKSAIYTGRIQGDQGADVASAAGAIALGYDGNTFEITGTNAITRISNVGWQNGSTITLIFTSTASLVDGAANSGTDIGFELGGNANFNATADDLITLKLCEVGGTQRWREMSRSAN